VSYVTHANADLTGKGKLARLVLEEGLDPAPGCVTLPVLTCNGEAMDRPRPRVRRGRQGDAPSRPRQSPNCTCVRTEQRIVALRFARRWRPKWPSTAHSASPPTWRSTSATPPTHGSEAPTKTPTVHNVLNRQFETAVKHTRWATDVTEFTVGTSIAITQIRMPSSRGHNYYKTMIQEGKNPREAARCLKRRLADHLWRTIINDERRTTNDERRTTYDGSGRTTGDDSAIHGGWLNSKDQVFGQVTSQTHHR
jgi:hypothetical protein